MLTKIKKRNGDIVDFDANRISTAIGKATTEMTGQADDALVQQLTTDVVELLSTKYGQQETAPSVEHIQDMVEQTLVESGNFEIAKCYILYRAEQAKKRAEARLDELKKLENNLLKIVKSSGKTATFSLAKLEKVLNRAAKGLKYIDTQIIIEEIKKNIFDGIATKDITKAVIMAAKAFIERDPEYSDFSARLLLDSVYKETFAQPFTEKNFEETYRNTFKINLEKGVNAGRINPELLKFDIDKLSAALDLSRDHRLNYLGLQTLYDRYFLHIDNKRFEAPQQFWMRVSMGLALAEKAADRETQAIEFYNNLSTLNFVSSTPTLFNAGTNHSQLSSCYLSTVEDDLDHIFKVIRDNAQLSKWAGGIGNDWTNIRATGAPIKGTNGKSQGVIPFLKIVNDTAVAVNQGGKRKGAVCSYLECWHFDYPEFLELRKNTGDDRRRTHDMNTASWIPDLFMKRLKSGGNWTLFSPDDVPDLHHIFGRKFEEAYEKYERMTETGEITLFKTMPAQDLWRKMITMVFETGHPWLTFKDPCNVRSPQDHVGVVHDSNLCTEITLNNSKDETAVCNLGSINLSQHIKDGQLDREKLQKTIEVGMRMLDNVVDINFYPTTETKVSNMKHRPVGMGMMGLADYFYMRNLAFDSDAAVDASDELMEFISYHAIKASSDLAQERGAYESFKGSKWDRDLFPVDTVKLLEEERGQTTNTNLQSRMDWNALRSQVKLQGMRNSNTMAIAPTATISNISGCIPCTEPIYKNLYVKSNMGGEFTVINKYLVEDLKALNMWGPAMIQELKIHDGSIQNIPEIPENIRAKYKEVFEIAPQWILRHAQARGKWIDQAQSTNIFYRGTSGKDIADIYMAAWEMGLKTTYYLRTLGASQVEKSTVNAAGTHKRSFGPGSTPIVNGTPGQPTPSPTDAPKQVESMLSAQAPDTKQTSIPTPPAATATSVASAAALMGDPDCEACQ